MQQTKPSEKAAGEQSQRESVRENNPFRKLGDLLEQWRRDLRDIQDVAADEQVEEKNVGEQNPEFSYVGEEEQFDTQGLGPAAPEQVQPLDMSMAVDEEPQSPKETKPSDNNADDPQPQGMEADSTSHPTFFGASIGDRSKDPEQMDLDYQEPTHPESPLAPPTSPPSTTDAVASTPKLTDDARAIWQQHDRSTHDLSLSLCEQLRLILEPTLATKMRGDFRSGKRLNMRRIIPYIASDYKKDKIWMRRTKPSKRQYQVLLAMDDSKSMSDSKSVQLAFETLALTAKALTQLEVGQISIVKFGEGVKVVHGFEDTFSAESGAKVVEQFGFNQSRTDVSALTKTSIELFGVARSQQDSRSNTELWQLEIIISDGICEDHETIRRSVREAFEAKIMMIFVILDAIHPERKDSILDIKSYSFADGGLKETRYLDSFPFNYFVVVRDVRELPAVLASALRQWFAEVAER
jgi:midasin